MRPQKEAQYFDRGYDRLKTFLEEAEALQTPQNIQALEAEHTAFLDDINLEIAQEKERKSHDNQNSRFLDTDTILRHYQEKNLSDISYPQMIEYIELHEEALREYPSNVEAKLYLLSAYGHIAAYELRQLNFETAEDYKQQGSALEQTLLENLKETQNESDFYNIASYYIYTVCDYKIAHRILQEAHERFPYDTGILFLLGFVAVKQKEYVEARDILLRISDGIHFEEAQELIAQIQHIQSSFRYSLKKILAHILTVKT